MEIGILSPHFPCPRISQGIAVALLIAAKDWAKHRRLDYIELKVVAGNKNAIDFYDWQGFNTVMHTMRTPL